MVRNMEGKTNGCAMRALGRPGVVEDPGMRARSLHGKPGDLGFDRQGTAGPHREGEEP